MAGGLALELDRDGYALRRGLLDVVEITELRGECERLQATAGQACVRDLLQRSMTISRLAAKLAAGGTLSPIDGQQPVRGILFDKTPGENWPVAWHQDLSIAVRDRPGGQSAPPPTGYGAPTQKDGVPHLQAPAQLLEQMVTVRLHLDDTPAENGALQLVPGSHHDGRIDHDDIARRIADHRTATCEASPGDALLMKPLIIHASRRARAGSPHQHRRVIHLEFAPGEALHPQLQWHERPC